MRHRLEWFRGSMPLQGDRQHAYTPPPWIIAGVGLHVDATVWIFRFARVALISSVVLTVQYHVRAVCDAALPGYCGQHDDAVKLQRLTGYSCVPVNSPPVSTIHSPVRTLISAKLFPVCRPPCLFAPRDFVHRGQGPVIAPRRSVFGRTSRRTEIRHTVKISVYPRTFCGEFSILYIGTGSVYVCIRMSTE